MSCPRRAVERRQLVAEGGEVVELRVDDAEADVAHRIHVGQPLEHHLADALRPDLGDPALLQRPFDVVDERAEPLRREALGRGLLDRARELPAVEFLPRAVALQDLDAR